MSDPTCNRAVVVKQRLQQVVLAGVRGRPGPMIVSVGVDSDGRLVLTLEDGTQVISDPINRPWGTIQGDITDQSDLMDLLADKVDGGTFEQFQQGMTQALAEKLAIDVYNQFVLDVADALAGKVGDDDPRLTDSRTPTGGAGGVLSGQYPNPGFAVDMATQAELDAVAAAKVDKVAGKQLSTEDYTTAEKSKLAGIEAGAQVNAVTSVAGKTGVVTLVKGDVGLGSVDNTSDANKPISTAQQEALDGKVDTTDPRMTDSREWSAATVTQAEAEAGTSTTRRAWTAQRVRQAIVAWWNGVTSAFGRGLVASADASEVRSALELGTAALRADEYFATAEQVGDIASALDAINGEVI